MSLRRRVYEILEGVRDKDPVATVISTVISLLILANVTAVVIETHLAIDDPRMRYFHYFEYLSITVFSVEYLLRLWTCVENEKYRHGLKGRLRWAVSFYALIDFMAVAPFFVPLLSAVDLRVARMLRLFRLLRIFKLGRYSKSMQLIGRVLKSKREDLISTLFILFVLLILASSLMYFAEHEAQPEDFGTISDAMWWGVAALSTVGYGDVFPTTTAGKLLAAGIAILGIGLFALPAGILASGYVEEVNAKRRLRRCPHCGEELGRVGLSEPPPPGPD